MKKILVMGGGNGTAISLCALKKIEGIGISAIVAMSDSGGSSAILKEEFHSLPPGDIMRAVLALSPYDFLTLKKIFYGNRFSEDLGKLAKHNLGNLFLMLGQNYTGDYVKAVRALEQAVEAVGHVYPVTLDRADLVAELVDGQIIKTEGKIDVPEYDLNIRIKKIGLEPNAQLFIEAKKVIEEADFIIFGPGSLYTSIIASILPEGVKQAIDNSEAKLIQVIGARHIKGETGPKCVSETVAELENYLPRKVDFIVSDAAVLNEVQQKSFAEKGWEMVLDDSAKMPDRKVFSRDLERVAGGMCDVKLGKVLKEIITKN